MARPAEFDTRLNIRPNGFDPLWDFPWDFDTPTKREKRARAVAENRVLRDRDGRFVGNPVVSTGVALTGR